MSEKVRWIWELQLCTDKTGLKCKCYWCALGKPATTIRFVFQQGNPNLTVNKVEPQNYVTKTVMLRFFFFFFHFFFRKASAANDVFLWRKRYSYPTAKWTPINSARKARTAYETQLSHLLQKRNRRTQQFTQYDTREIKSGTRDTLRFLCTQIDLAQHKLSIYCSIKL